MGTKKIEKVAYCRTKNDITFGYIYKINGITGTRFGFYLCGYIRPEFSGEFNAVRQYVENKEGLKLKMYKKFINLLNQ